MPVPLRRLMVMSSYELCGCTLRPEAGAPMRAMPRHATSEIAVMAMPGTRTSMQSGRRHERGPSSPAESKPRPLA